MKLNEKNAASWRKNAADFQTEFELKRSTMLWGERDNQKDDENSNNIDI